MPLDELGRHRRDDGRGGPARPGSRSSPATPRSSTPGTVTASTSTPPGIGLVPAGVDLGPHQVRPGDAILVSGPIGMHGIAVLSVRDGLEFGSDIVTDSAPLNGLVAQALLDAGVERAR